MEEFLHQAGRTSDWYEADSPNLLPNDPELLEYYRLSNERNIAMVWGEFYKGYFESIKELSDRVTAGQNPRTIHDTHAGILKSQNILLQKKLSDLAVLCATTDIFSNLPIWNDSINDDDVQLLASKKLDSGELELYPRPI